jgi:hypothetical protein
MSALDKPAGEPAGTHEQGFLGKVPDPTPNEHYTVGGVLAGKPTPETDEEAHRAARAAVAAPAPGPLTRAEKTEDEAEQ